MTKQLNVSHAKKTVRAVEVRRAARHNNRADRGKAISICSTDSMCYQEGNKMTFYFLLFDIQNRGSLEIHNEELLCQSRCVSVATETVTVTHANILNSLML